MTYSVTIAKKTKSNPKTVAVLDSNGFLLLAISILSNEDCEIVSSCLLDILERTMHITNRIRNGIANTDAIARLNKKARTSIRRYIIPLAIMMADTACLPTLPFFSRRAIITVVAVLLYKPPRIPFSICLLFTSDAADEEK